MDSHAIPLFLYEKKNHALPPPSGASLGGAPLKNKKIIKRKILQPGSKYFACIYSHTIPLFLCRKYAPPPFRGYDFLRNIKSHAVQGNGRCCRSLVQHAIFIFLKGNHSLLMTFKTHIYRNSSKMDIETLLKFSIFIYMSYLCK